MPNYGDLNYWENRYSEQKDFTFDWSEDYDTLKPIIEDLLCCGNFRSDICSENNNLSNSNIRNKSKQASYNHYSPNILMLGCGNSELSELIYQDNLCKNIFNIDLSNNVIKSMRERCKTMEAMSWEVMDARELKFAPGFFDLVIDKCMLDTVLCGEKSYVNAAIVTKEVQKVLKIGGVYMIVSHGDPSSRLIHLNREHLGFEVSIQCVKKEFSSEDDLFSKHTQEKINYIYICRKNIDADILCQENFPRVYFELEKSEIIEDDEKDIQSNDDL